MNSRMLTLDKIYIGKLSEWMVDNKSNNSNLTSYSNNKKS